MFDHFSKHIKVRQKYSVTRRIFNYLLGAWKCGQTRSFVVGILLEKQFINDNLFLLGGVVMDINSSGTSLMHWYDMLKTPNQVHTHWHTLEKLTNHEQE